MTEQVLKKEDNLIQNAGFWHKAYRGTLTLTRNDISFLLHKSGKEILRVPLSNILSVNTEKVSLSDSLSIVYKDGNTERRARFLHANRSEFVFALASPNHFLSWEQSINDARFHRSNENSSPLGDLERLAALKDKGVLTDDEFTAKKKQLLGL